MAPLTITLTAVLQWTSWWSSSPWRTQNVLGNSNRDWTLRPVVESDLDDFVTVFIDAFKPSAGWQYGRYHDKDYTNYTWHCTRQYMGELWKNADLNNTFVNVIAVPIEDTERASRRERVVSLAVWNWISPDQQASQPLSVFMPSVPSAYFDRGSPTRVQAGNDKDFDCSKHLDTNMTRLADMERQMDAAMQRYIYSSDKSQLYLNLLATHPDWDGNGFAAAQLNVRFKKALVKKVPITLLASPAGYPLYDSLDFASIANITIKKLDGLGTLWFEYMRRARDA